VAGAQVFQGRCCTLKGGRIERGERTVEWRVIKGMTHKFDATSQSEHPGEIHKVKQTTTEEAEGPTRFSSIER